MSSQDIVFTMDYVIVSIGKEKAVIVPAAGVGFLIVAPKKEAAILSNSKINNPKEELLCPDSIRSEICFTPN